MNVGFYTSFQYWSKPFTFDSTAIGTLSAALQCPRHIGRHSMDYVPSNYLITLRSTKQSRLGILPKDTNTLALVGLSAPESCTVPLDHTHTHSPLWRVEICGNLLFYFDAISWCKYLLLFCYFKFVIAILM